MSTIAVLRAIGGLRAASGRLPAALLLRAARCRLPAALLLPAARCRLPAALLAACCLLLAAGCRQDMHNQPKYRPLRATPFFGDGSSARPLVEGTVARGTLQEDEAFFTGKVGKADVTEMPLAVDETLLDRGQDRYQIFCTPCHDATGSGHGMVVQRGLRPPPSFHADRIRQMPVGHYYDVITNGFGAMPDYRAQIAPRDRWAIVAYVRALQLSQHASPADIPGGDPTKIAAPTPKDAHSGEKH